MKLAYFPESVARNGASVLDAVLDSAQFKGFALSENDLDADVAVIWSVLWNGRMASNQAVYQHYRSQGKPVIVLDVGALYRNETWKLAVNNINATGYYGHLENLDWDRPRKLEVSVAISYESDPGIVIAAQHTRSEQVAKIGSMEQWICDQVSILKQHTDRPIRIRPHPRSSLNLSKLPRDIAIERPERVASTYDSFNLRFDCHAIVNYNSGPGIQAAIAGVRPVVDRSSLAHPVSVGHADIEQPYTVDRDTWLVQICHTEYTLDELRRGTWFKRIEPALTSLTAPV